MGGERTLLQYSITPSLQSTVMFAMAIATDNAPLFDDLSSVSGVRLRLDEPLARYTSMKIGGPADYFIEADHGAALAQVAHRAAPPSGAVMSIGQRQQCPDQRPRRARRGDSFNR